MNILVQAHPVYNYLDATVIQGLQNLEHNTLSIDNNRANYLKKTWSEETIDLFIQFVAEAGPLAGTKSVLVWGQDDHTGLDKEFEAGFEYIFVRDWSGKGLPISFGIEDRYYCQTENKPLSEREIDITFLGNLLPHRQEYLNRLSRDFKHLKLEFGSRKYNTPDTVWSPHTYSYCAHDPRYFETLGNSKICLSFAGAGPDCARHWEILASGAIPIIEKFPCVLPEPKCLWFENYDELYYLIEHSLKNLPDQGEAFEFNKLHHNTAARGRYILEMIFRDRCLFSSF